MKEKPPIDRMAVDAETTAPAPMPTAENEPPCVFRSGAGISAEDVWEIALMYLLEMTKSPYQPAPGELRNVVLPAARVAQLHPAARQFMKPVQ